MSGTDNDTLEYDKNRKTEETVDESDKCSFFSHDDECSSISYADNEKDSRNSRLSYHQDLENSHRVLIAYDNIAGTDRVVPISTAHLQLNCQKMEDDKVSLVSEEAGKKYASDPPESFLLLFLLISFGYMLPWTSLGSLISYYKANYSASFYVKLYCAYYLPGLPIALIQFRYDTYMDSIFSSQSTYFFRGVSSYLIMISCLISMIFVRSEKILIGLFSLLGICAWLSHGTSSILASMYPPSAIVNLQTGVRCPEIFALIAVTALSLGNHASQRNLTIFFILNCALISISALSWIFVITSGKSKHYFDIKDQMENTETLTACKSPLQDGNMTPRSPNRRRSPNEDVLQKSLLWDEDTLSSVFNNLESQKRKIIGQRNDENHESTSDTRETEMTGINQKRKAIDSDEKSVIRTLCAALFVIMFFSILQASFFAYVTGSVPGRDIEQILYFVRLFFDLLGRPLTRLWRPPFLKTCNQVLGAAIFRIVFVIAFFLYILCPTLPRSDILIIIIVAVFSMSSGYLSVLIYEYASLGREKNTQAAATGLLNLSFQSASFFAVLISLGITSSPWFNELPK